MRHQQSLPIVRYAPWLTRCDQARPLRLDTGWTRRGFSGTPIQDNNVDSAPIGGRLAGEGPLCSVPEKRLTNSLAANNHTTAFVGYRKQRKQQIGVITELYEYRPDAAAQTELFHELAPGQPVPHLGLHAKTAVYDRRTVFVGSFNLDPRSENLNTEIGLLVESPELGRAVAESILNDMSPGNAWQVRLND